MDKLILGTKKITDHCVGCNKTTTHTQVFFISKHGKTKGKKLPGGWTCDECGCEWDTLDDIFSV